MRLFAALLPPPEALAELEDAAAELRSLPAADRLRWTVRDNWHITLAFYGEVPDEVQPALHERLARAARRARPLALRLARGGRFGDRALWAGVRAASAVPEDGDGGGDGEPPRRTEDRLRRLAGAAAAAGRRAGVEARDPLRFRAHLSLAHTRSRRDEPGGLGESRVDLRPYVAALDSFAGTPWTADEVELVRSRLPRSGVPGEQPRYERLAAWALGG